MDETDIAALEDALSLERFARYLDWAGGDRRLAVELYTLNTRLSESLYTPIQMLEIALRNRIHAVLSAELHAHWYDETRCQLDTRQAEQLASARNDLSAAQKPDAPGRVVAALTFGYWTAFFNTDYEDLWRKHMHRIAKRADGKSLTRKDFSRSLTPIRLLRNRIAHHEPILEWNLPKHYANIIQLTEWLSPAAATWCRAHSRFDGLYPNQGIILNRPNPSGAKAPA
jgi:hypothetical protein